MKGYEGSRTGSHDLMPAAKRIQSFKKHRKLKQCWGQKDSAIISLVCNGFGKRKWWQNSCVFLDPGTMTLPISTCWIIGILSTGNEVKILMAESQMAPPVDWILLPEVYSWLVRRGYWRLEGPEYSDSCLLWEEFTKMCGAGSKIYLVLLGLYF